MRQKCLEVSSPLMVAGVGLVDTGDVFDAPLLVPGCVPVEDGTEEATQDADSTAEPPPPGEPQ